MFVAGCVLWIVKVIMSRVFILVAMIALLIATHSVQWLANATYTVISTMSEYATSQQFKPKSVATLRAENARLTAQTAQQKRTVSNSIKRIQPRSRRAALANLAAAGGEALPFVGLGIIAGATAYEMKTACDTMRDLYDMQIAVEPTLAIHEDRNMVCGLQIPSQAELWSAVKESPGAAWDSAVATTTGATDWASSIEKPNFDGGWQRAVAAIGEWF